MARSIWLRMPVSGLRIWSHSTATATPARIDGTNRMVRNNTDAADLAVQQQRQPRPVTMNSGTDSTTYRTVTLIDCENRWSSSIRA